MSIPDKYLEPDNYVCMLCGRGPTIDGGLQSTYNGPICDACYDWQMGLDPDSLIIQ